MARFIIRKGPSKSNLKTALFDATSSEPQLQEFVLAAWPEDTGKIAEETTPVSLQIQSVMREDGSGESWCVLARDYESGISYDIYYHSGRQEGVANTK